jgi:hypothetical protein
MKSTVSLVGAAVGLAGCFFTAVAQAQAQDSGSGGPTAGARISPKVDQEINQAVGSSTGASSADVDAQIRDLESTRTAIDQQKQPAISLGVSGWVDQQVQYNVKQ